MKSVCSITCQLRAKMLQSSPSRFYRIHKTQTTNKTICMRNSLNCHYFHRTIGLHLSLPDFWHYFLKEQSSSSFQQPPNSGDLEPPFLVQMAHTQSSLLAAHVDTQFTAVYHCSSLAGMSRSTIWTRLVYLTVGSPKDLEKKDSSDMLPVFVAQGPACR